MKAHRPRCVGRCRIVASGAALILVVAALPACSYVERGRALSDAALIGSHEAAMTAVAEAQEERLRLRRRRCFNPLLTPAVLADAAADPRLGPAWIDELLQDCPQFAALLSQHLLQRAERPAPFPCR
jgi:hypothetical protein